MKSCKFMLILECTEIKVDLTKHILYAKTSDFIIHAIPPPYIGKFAFADASCPNLSYMNHLKLFCIYKPVIKL